MMCLAGAGENRNASQFYITLGTDLDSLDGEHTIFGEVGGTQPQLSPSCMQAFA